MRNKTRKMLCAPAHSFCMMPRKFTIWLGVERWDAGGGSRRFPGTPPSPLPEAELPEEGSIPHAVASEHAESCRCSSALRRDTQAAARSRSDAAAGQRPQGSCDGIADLGNVKFCDTSVSFCYPVEPVSQLYK